MDKPSITFEPGSSVQYDPDLSLFLLFDDCGECCMTLSWDDMDALMEFAGEYR